MGKQWWTTLHVGSGIFYRVAQAGCLPGDDSLTRCWRCRNTTWIFEGTCAPAMEIHTLIYYYVLMCILLYEHVVDDLCAAAYIEGATASITTHIVRKFLDSEVSCTVCSHSQSVFTTTHKV